MKAVLLQVQKSHSFQLEEINISGNPELMNDYQNDIPVLYLNGKEIARHRVSEEELLRVVLSV